MDIKAYMQGLGLQARAAGREISRTESGKKNGALLEIAKVIDSRVIGCAEERSAHRSRYSIDAPPWSAHHIWVTHLA